MYNEFEIRQVPIRLASEKRKVSEFLGRNGIRLDDDLDYYAAVYRLDDDVMLAGGGFKGNVIKCIAVDESMREEHLTNRLIAHLQSEAQARGFISVKVFTKPSNRQIFESMGFCVIAEAPNAIFMENAQRGIKTYCDYLRKQRREGRIGAIVMNANPFTKGHRYLIEQASAQVDFLYVIAVKEDKSLFTSEERLAMIKAGCSDIENVIVCEGSDYAVSAATFPTYFLKEISSATDTQITLDLDIFARHIAPALNASVRFVGSEPLDALTNRYNQLMVEQLPAKGVQVVQIERLAQDGTTISATAVRQSLDVGHFIDAAKAVWKTTVPYLIAWFAQDALFKELNLTPKPGLVDRDNSGAHRDMDYFLMKKSIETLRPYFVKIALEGFEKTDDDVAVLIQLGIDAEAAMKSATNGVNTHKGALFALGLVCFAAARQYNENQTVTLDNLQQSIKSISQRIPSTNGTHGAEASNKYSVVGALQNAQNGYPMLFDKWIPFYSKHTSESDALYRTLLYIMSTLDDTNVYYRVGEQMAQQVKVDAKTLLDDFSIQKLEQMNADFVRKNISPGGAADMLSLTLYVYHLTK